VVERFSGVVLTGGKSTRMGRDKALLPVEGVPMALRVAHALQEAGASEIACVGGDAEGLRALGVDVIDDGHPGEGPLGGFITALAWAHESLTVISPCDLATPEARSFRDLVEALAASDALASLPIVEGAWRALPAALRASALPLLEEAFATGERSVHRVVEGLTFVQIDAGPLADADTPDQLPGHR
jgi:molybdopterin-guanine dinucleotide biosynthesis protein A